MNAPLVDETVDIHELLDSLTPPRCEWRSTNGGFAGSPVDECDEPPAFYMAVSCGCGAMLCAPHAARTRKRIDGPGLTICTRHGNRPVTIEWRPL